MEHPPSSPSWGHCLPQHDSFLCHTKFTSKNSQTLHLYYTMAWKHIVYHLYISGGMLSNPIFTINRWLKCDSWMYTCCYRKLHPFLYIMVEDSKGYDHQFVEPPLDDLLCLICLCVARDPQQINCCGKLLCKGCLEEHREHSNNCPLCRKHINSFADAISNTVYINIIILS